MAAETLLARLREIEMRMGSKKVIAKGPRILDIDILLYGDETIATPELQVPHPRMTQRRFVLVPLAEIAPDVQSSFVARDRKRIARGYDRSQRSSPLRVQK